MADYYVREEDGTSKYILEDSSGDYLLETSGATVNPTFIASVTVVQAPVLSLTPTLSTDARFGAPAFAWAYFAGAAGALEAHVPVPFIGSVTAAYTPTLTSTQVLAPFISSHTHVYQPTLKVAFTGGGVSQVALEMLTSNTDANAYVSQVTLEIIVPWYKGLHIWEKTGQTGG